MDLSVNKPAKHYLTGCFEDWYAHEIVKQVKNNEEEEEEEMCLQPVNMSFPVMKELSAKWLVGMFDYIRENPNLVVNGFVHAGISTAFDGYIDSTMDLNIVLVLFLFYTCN